MNMFSLEVGKTTCGKWKLTQEIGHGAYGVVYKAIGPDGETSAVKICQRDIVGDDCYERELRGAKLFKTLPPQEGLIHMRELAETDWGFYAVMDLADDEFDDTHKSIDSYRPKTLARIIAGEKALPLNECIDLALTLTKGLCTLQLHHLLHRDIKPENIIYVNARPVLSDPGLLIRESEAVSLVGTPKYVPPEKFTSAASDVYSLGITLKAASFGRPVDELDKGPAMEADTGNGLFPAWWKILNKATHPIASHRYHSAKALLKDLLALRLKTLLTTRTFGLPRYAWFLIAVMTVVIVASALKVKANSDYSIHRWEQLDAFQKQYTEEAKESLRRVELEERKREERRKQEEEKYLAEQKALQEQRERNTKRAAK